MASLHDGKIYVPSIPLRITLALDNISSPNRPPPLYILVPRFAYLSSVARQAWPHFQRVLPRLPPGCSSHEQPWFDARRIPLRATFSLGVLYDLLASPSDLPWDLTIHYTTPHPSISSSSSSSSPDPAAAGWDNNLPSQALFFHSLKEAAFICRGPDGSASVMKMTGATQDSLWAALERADHDRYRASMSTLKLVPSERQGACPSIPVRVFMANYSLPDSTATTSIGGTADDTRALSQRRAPPLLSSWDDVYMTSRPWLAMGQDGAWVTLGDFLISLLPKVRFSNPVAAQKRDLAVHARDDGGVEREAGAEGEGTPHADGVTGGDGNELPLPISQVGDSPPLRTMGWGESPGDLWIARIGGVTPPLEVHLAWLHAKFHSPDYFLYVVVHRAYD